MGELRRRSIPLVIYVNGAPMVIGRASFPLNLEMRIKTYKRKALPVINNQIGDLSVRQFERQTRKPKGFYAEDLDRLDALHEAIGLGPLWQVSETREKLLKRKKEN